MSVKFIAYYLPQFHSIPENDSWWGLGFTEWTNVKKARPLFEGHYQPRIPSELGYYNLLSEDIFEKQIELAKKFGLFGFCFYHYWFGGGKLLLEKPLKLFLENSKLNFPFMLCWANQTWKGVWFGESFGKTLIEQKYFGDEDIEMQFEYLLPFFKDPRYISIVGKPVLQIYLPLEHPNINRFSNKLNELAIKAGFQGVYLIGCNISTDTNPSKLGLDASISNLFHSFRMDYSSKYFTNSFLKRIESTIRFYQKRHWIISQREKPLILNYSKVSKIITNWRNVDFDHYPQIVPDWDNSARAANKSLILKNSTPKEWGRQVKKSIDYIQNSSSIEKFIFIKSWNEWAEGNYLEPDEKWGFSYLEELEKQISFLKNG